MKLKIEYTKRANGSYNGKIVVLDNQDFPTNRIFSENRVVGREDYNVDDAEDYYSTYNDFTLEELGKMIQQEIEAVKEMVQKYRNMPVPEKEIIEF